MNGKKIRVAIRGAAGLLGSRLIVALARAEGIQITGAVVRKDPSLDRLLSRLVYGGPDERAAFRIPNWYMDERRPVIDDYNRKYSGMMVFQPVEYLDLAGSCDAVIDAAVGKDHGLRSQYTGFSGEIVWQDGEYPRGRLIAPPLMAQDQRGNRWRQGGCFLSGIVPALAAVKDVLASARLNLLMQYDERERDNLIGERLNSFRIVLGSLPRMSEELGQLFGRGVVEVENILQVPGMFHYAVIASIQTSAPFTVDDFKARISLAPRVRLLPDEVLSSFELNLARAVDDRIPPIAVFSRTLTSERHGSGSLVRFVLGLYYRTLAVLPNVDALRMLCAGMDPLDAMRLTDKEAGFV